MGFREVDAARWRRVESSVRGGEGHAQVIGAGLVRVAHILIPEEAGRAFGPVEGDGPFADVGLGDG